MHVVENPFRILFRIWLAPAAAVSLPVCGFNLLSWMHGDSIFLSSESSDDGPPPLFDGKLRPARHRIYESGALGITRGEHVWDYRHLDPRQTWTGRSRYTRIQPLWLVIPTAILPSLWFLRWLRRFNRANRVAMDLCPDCGYDLRGTKDRCPECGRIKIPFHASIGHHHLRNSRAG